MSVLGRCVLRKSTINRLLFFTTFVLYHKKVCFFWASQQKKLTNNTQGEWSKLETPHEKCKKISQEFIQWIYLGCFNHFVMEFISNNFSFFHQTLVLFSYIKKLNTTNWETSVTAKVERQNKTREWLYLLSLLLFQPMRWKKGKP